ncbi:cryptochrome/photolyase family protein [Thalassotalea euphylliae]|uniref:Cryptochrome/photolyase family protein n=1 Tax=Thalassotalea euphylliae TaxID=1655234 RepID=A0A3E0UA61_9GAMM|nr:cryptochrome/photolyase family protein [Thalassotalea euphylliae]REL33921.1 cryptochrome/photolyase family protein [Thalassotalea euphylliae]
MPLQRLVPEKSANEGANKGVSKDNQEAYKELRLILGDQLNAGHSWYQTKQSDVLYVIAELKQEQSYVKHHVQKIQAFFLAMSQFADALSQAGHQVLHLTLDDTQDFQDLPSLLTHLLMRYQCQCFSYQRPDEYRLAEQLFNFASRFSGQSRCVETEHFFLNFNELSDYFQADKRHRLEVFYRKMRKRFNYLMAGDEPEGGQWNYDQDNRHKLKPKDIEQLPEPLVFANDVAAINQRLQKHNIANFGEQSDQLLWPVNRRQAKELLEHFCVRCLPKFGQFQDAMTCQGQDMMSDRQWSLYHARLSFALNAKILSPQHVVDAAIDYYRLQPELISLAQIEGFVRQILGWREFVRGIYWANMPNYAEQNNLSANEQLPTWFWTGKTKMNCLHHAIQQSLQYAYAHHIQRLMITGNFCLLAGIHPDQVDAWYLGIYIDAIEWVEMPNTRGMSQFADGGIVASKAYAASGNYVDKMSDYCKSCAYKVKEKTTDDACPLNSLYWHFMTRHRDKFGTNPRQAMVYRNWDKQSESQQAAILAKADRLLLQLDKL